MLIGALALLGSLLLLMALWLMAYSRSLGERVGVRQAAIALSFAALAGTFLTWTLLRPGARRDWLRLGLPSRRSWPVLVALVGVGLVGLAALAVLASHIPGFREAMERQRHLGAWRSRAELARALLLLAFVPAFFEELYFRGYLLHRLARHWGVRAALLTQAGLFAVLHGPAWPIALGIGLLNAGLTLASGSLWPAIVLHAINNTLAVLASRAP